MKNIFYITFCICLASSLIAQEDTIQFNTATSVPFETTEVAQDVKVSQNGFDSELEFGAVDSQWYDHKLNAVHLLGNAFVNYEDKELMADYIILEMSKNIAEAKQFDDRPMTIQPTFKDGEKTYKYKRLKYNFTTEKGIVYDAISQEGEFHIHGQKTKFVSSKNDTLFQNDILYNANSVITTCGHDHPHFGFRAKKLKVVSEKVAVFGPSNLELGGVPTPIWLPFGFYPLTQGKSSGFIFPQNYEFNSQSQGFGLLGFGWYFPFNDYVHLKLTADLYTRGSWGIYANTTYKKLYKYSGSLNLQFNNRLIESSTEIEPESQKGFSIRFAHNQDSKAHPFVNIGGKLDMVANNNTNRINNDAESVLTSTYTSNFFYRHNMPRSPFTLRIGINHNQNTRTGEFNITFPDIDLSMNTINPFENKNRGGNEEKWYEKITFDYDFKMKSFVRTNDTVLFTRQMYEDVKSGFDHTVTTGFSTRVMKNFNFVFSADYDETWVLNTIDKDIDRIQDLAAEGFTLKDTLVTTNNNEFASFRTYGASVSLRTQLFGTKTFSKGWLRGVRHTMKPSVGFSYSPDTRSTYQDTLIYTDDERLPEVYTQFDNGPFNTPSFSDLQSQLTYSINNVLEIKYFSKKDSTEKKFKIFDNVNLSGNYNFAADSLKWSRVSLNSTTRLFSGITTITTRFTFDPYLEENDRSIDQTVWSRDKKLARLEFGQINVSNRFTFKKIREMFAKEKNEESRPPPNQEEPKDEQGGSPFSQENKPKELISLQSILDNLSISYNLLYTMRGKDDKTISELQTHSLAINGRIPLTENWSINIGNLGYDFAQSGLSYTTVTFTRKLHCWDMNFSWSPNRDTYSFAIGVTSNTLSFLKYNYGQNNVDGLLRRF